MVLVKRKRNEEVYTQKITTRKITGKYPATKKCSKCLKYKKLDDFNYMTNGKYNCQSYCRKCKAIVCKKYKRKLKKNKR